MDVFREVEESSFAGKLAKVGVTLFVCACHSVIASGVQALKNKCSQSPQNHSSTTPIHHAATHTGYNRGVAIAFQGV